MIAQNKEDEIKKALKRGTVMIYGAHLTAIELYRYLKKLKKDFEFAGFVVSAMEGNPSELEGERVRDIYSCQAAKDTTVLIAMPEKYHDETEAYARRLGYFSFLRVSLEEMSELKGRELLCSCKKLENPKFNLDRDEYDTSWLNMYDASNLSRQQDHSAKRHYKFPTLYYLDSEAMFREAEKFDFYRDYERVFGCYHNLHALPVYEQPGVFPNAGKIEKILNIYMVFSQWDSAKMVYQKYPSWIYPVQAGSALSEHRANAFLDEAGDTISEKNGIFAEMTAAYWIWKNAKPVKYKGLCHYRRHFVLSEGEIMSLERNGIDVILTTPRYVPGGLKEMFLAETPVKEPVYQHMIKAVEECHIKDKDGFSDYMRECLYCPNNMVAARSEIYDAYCEWVFPILFRMLEIDKATGYDHTQDRHIAYAAELLTSYFFVKNREKYCMAAVDYKFY